MSNGFFIVAQNSNTCDYIRQAYYLAKTIKETQVIHNSVSIMTDDVIPDEYKSVFDYIIPIPFQDHAKDSTWKVENRWKAYHASPYDRTILLDADMLILSDLTNVWENLYNKPIYFTSQVKNFKGSVITDTVYRKAFVENGLPNLYSGFCYFEKSDQALEFWKLVEYITYNWQRFYYEFTPKSTQKFYSLDVTVSIAEKILGFNCYDNDSKITFTHMKSKIQGWSITNPDWTQAANISIIDKKTVFINQFRQLGILHYVEDNFLNEYISYAS